MAVFAMDDANEPPEWAGRSNWPLGGPVQLRSVFGHSAGADWASFVGMTSQDVARVALMVAPPPPGEPEPGAGAEEGGGTDRYADTYSFVYGKQVPEWYSPSFRSEAQRDWDSVHDVMRTPGHKPLLLVLGERDEPRGHPAVLEQFDQFAEPKTLVMIGRSDHYGNSAQALGLVFYDRAVARQLIGELAGWIGGSTVPSERGFPPP